jgi:hypothetical protein
MTAFQLHLGVSVTRGLKVRSNSGFKSRMGVSKA